MKSSLNDESISISNAIYLIFLLPINSLRNGARWGFRRSRCGFARIPLRFDAPAGVSREFRCISMPGLFWGGHLGCRPQRRKRWDGSLVSTLPLWFRANSVAFGCSRCGFVRIPLPFDAHAMASRELRLVASSGLFWGGHVGCRPRGETGPWFPAVVSHEFCCVSMLPLWFRANSGLSWPLQASSGGAT